MSLVTQNRVINLVPGISAPLVIHCSCGDVGRTISLVIINGDSEYTVPSGASASVHGIRQDGAGWGPYTCTVSGSAVSFDLTAEMTAVSGGGIAEITIISGNRIVGSANFCLLVEDAVFPDGVTHENDPSVYQNILDYVHSKFLNDIPPMVTDWLEDHIINPSNPPIDDTLTVSGAAADAKTTGDRLFGSLLLDYSKYDEIVSATDLNAIAGDPGNYWIPYDKAQTILNIPVKQTGRLFVLPGKGTASTADGGTQIFLSAQKGGEPNIWMRGWKGQNWKPWRKIATNEETDFFAKTFQALFNVNSMFVDLSNVEIVQGSYIKTDGTIDVNSNLSYTSDYIEIPDNVASFTVNRVIWIPEGTEFLRSHMIWFYDANNALLGNGTETLTDRMLTTIPPKEAKYLRANFSVNMQPFIVANFADDQNGYVGEYSGTFPGSKKTVKTDIYLKADVEYAIKFTKKHEGSINLYITDVPTPYRNAQAYMNEVHFTPTTEGYLTLYNVGDVVESFDIKVYEKDSMAYRSSNEPQRYIVSKHSTRADYTSITQCFLDLKDDVNPKIIEIWEGEYDIYQEYVDANVPIYTGTNPSLEYFDYCVWVPQNSHVIGKGIVRLKWMPDPATDSITPNQCKCVSPLNVAGSATIENLEVYCKNGRYCLHNDALGKPEFTGAVQVYKNLRLYKYANDENEELSTTYGFAHTTGFGIDRAMHHLYENCKFVNYGDRYAFYGHTRGSAISSEVENSDITCEECVFVSGSAITIRFGNSTDRNLHIRTMFNSCFIPGKISSIKESDVSSPCANAFDVQLLNSGNVVFETTDTDNPYPPQTYDAVLFVRG